MDQGIDGGYLTANLLHASLFDCTLGTKAGTTYSFSGGVGWWHYSNVLYIRMDIVLGICFLRGCCVTLSIHVLDQEVAILNINLKGSTVSTVIIYFLIEGILCSTDYTTRHIVINVMSCHSSLNCNDICQLTLQVFSNV